jgi:ABC-type nitrate/sulfonate/bicarbonate transport system ATPase subunit
MGRDFDLAMGDAFIATPQVLRAVGAPGLGKSTFVNCAWSLLDRRLAVVKADEERWQRWKRLGGDVLERRLDSWKTSFGSLVFKIDMSDPCECRSAFTAKPRSP